ncbi:MAG: response regulator transcription factor [Elusimicrobiales bacterium]|nr:response regulator transcription factor [Elusimicrobiales bacterium]
MSVVKPRVLVVEDDENIAAMLLEVLYEAGYEAVHFSEAGRAFDWLKVNDVDLVLSDIGLPGISGMELCALVRDTARIAALPVLMLTALNDELHKVAARRKGADDYVVKPFSNNELLARIEALLRRSRNSGGLLNIMRSGGLALNLDSGEVYIDKAPVHLLPKEYALLAMFLAHKNHIYSWEAMRDKVWGLEAIATRDTIKVTIHRLKAKLGGYGVRIEALPGIGYRWAEKKPGAF